ncbi:MAG: Rrf2 family transcriptional regulator [Atopobium sp.]|uniref:RrF2 family transcriptional regulator n=1 Tax=Atopobium sp. TaxID=1872650 RepID=UPI002A7FA76F|nr:Rrf2 family transcriptional regulator [Atopobium sp.]MDY4522303.1 Rrf2 family transcriptional regulator [Atopobium sp.]
MPGMFSTKGRYALRVMSDLAVHEGWVSLGDISKRQGISRKYLEQVTSLLLKGGLVDSQRGKGGGYKLSRKPEDYTLGEILRVAEGGTLAPVNCLDCSSGEICEHIKTCTTLPIWRDLGVVTSQFLDSKHLTDLIASDNPKDDVTTLASL